MTGYTSDPPSRRQDAAKPLKDGGLEYSYDHALDTSLNLKTQWETFIDLCSELNGEAMDVHTYAARAILEAGFVEREGENNNDCEKTLFGKMREGSDGVVDKGMTDSKPSRPHDLFLKSLKPEWKSNDTRIGFALNILDSPSMPTCHSLFLFDSELDQFICWRWWNSMTTLPCAN
jgi:hypothetical protein